jgi:hypothetical protein
MMTAPAPATPPSPVFRDVPYVLDRLAWMRERQIWPDGARYLWTDAFGVVLLVSLYRELGEERYLEEARRVVAEVERVLGRSPGLRIGEESDRDGQYFHYLAMWLFALDRLGRIEPEYRSRAVALAKAIHPRFVRPGVGVYWKMTEDLSEPYPGYGLGALDPYHGYVVYRLLAPDELAVEIAEMKALVDQSKKGLHVTQDLGVGMMLWMTQFFPGERWATLQRQRCLAILDSLWIDPPGYFCRQPGQPAVKFAFTNYGVSVGLQAAAPTPEQTARIARLHRFFDAYRSGDEYDLAAITHVMACSSHLPGELVPGAQPG